MKNNSLGQQFSQQSLSRGARTVCSLSVLGVLLSACVVGPNFKTPLAPLNADQAAYGAPLAGTVAAPGAAGVAQTLVSGQDIPSAWWQVFHSPALDSLIRTALEKSPNLAAAQAALRQAQENYTAQAGSVLYPAVSGSLGANRQQQAAVATSGVHVPAYDLYNASVSVSYAVDLFGGNQRGLEALRAGVDYQRFQVEAAYLSLTANLVTSAIREASLRAQLQATEQIIASQNSQLEVLEKQFKIGAIAKASLLAQRNLLAQTRAGVPALQKSLEQTRNQLAVYAGKLPGEADLPHFELESLQLPATLPLTVPSTLLRQRPDIRASESLLQQASAQVGVATAAQYPQLNLTANYGYSGTDSGKLFSSNGNLWSIGAGLTAPLFNGGALSAKRRAAEAAYDQVAAQYRNTVLMAFQNVADSLRALDYDAQTLKQQAEVEALAKETLDLTTKQYQLGSVSSLALLDAKRSYQSARIALVQAQASRYADTAALFQALGGGWWNRSELADISRTAASQ
ncbi:MULTISPECIES: efflux transporter outer membrane subunit [unclassified Undibacterium]|uniref:efflux transporter outer membrane subunit n=1 Tax=unclassified Undibacterium TaxID=2630295 RepID=UPI002AC9E8D0|nr:MULTISPECIES: efflux transporter outer membrane subunit [unclassified Undibacterium]MEB0139320.1 efflux transporter outer membrane subunit [Undibacterium sp. CCC2.1]MEB0172164.1 efflux transporter outer membrane subunit [Undibacterium sp. CCC1.1]MEB0176045.1 efflux transporter outer membrane subunit [Undibacterium sp. CCC3.4]MEB0215357.1 efflux transporter outer membrane subunit [Undibacterium sp. 5I2]WPX43432.1 efflux transporter outer membrane subunit [Undibacterium sp. CCC3.4]